MIGIVFMIRSALQSNFVNVWMIFFYLLFLFFFGYSIVCGWLCLKAHPYSIVHSLINQYLQLIHLSVAGFSFNYAAGFYLALGIDLTESFSVSFDADISTLRIFLNTNYKTILVNFNLVAFFLIYWLDRLRRNAKLEDELQQADSIGEDEPFIATK